MLDCMHFSVGINIIGCRIQARFCLGILSPPRESTNNRWLA